mgnify:CR=1 FL=1
MVNLYNLYIKPTLALCLFFLVLPLTLSEELKVPAEELQVSAAAVIPAENVIQANFDPLFYQLSVELAKYKHRFLADPRAFHRFIGGVVKPRWDSVSTTSALIGKARFKQLPETDKLALVAAVDNTLQRYAFEGLDRYSGQLFRVVDVVVDKSAHLGWVQVLMESPLIPDLHLDVLIKKMAAGDWKAVDIRFKGVTYVAIKKHKFRETMDEKGIQALIDDLQAKNQQYFDEICRKANIVGKPPCPVR